MKVGSKEWWMDRAALIAVSIVGVGIAWVFARATGNYATEIIVGVLFVVLLLDNRRMRKRLKDRNPPG